MLQQKTTLVQSRRTHLKTFSHVILVLFFGLLSLSDAQASRIHMPDEPTWAGRQQYAPLPRDAQGPQQQVVIQMPHVLAAGDTSQTLLAQQESCFCNPRAWSDAAKARACNVIAVGSIFCMTGAAVLLVYYLCGHNSCPVSDVHIPWPF
jgi:hypothetical protein